MCKILVMSGLKPENQDTNFEFIYRISSRMSVHNTDGLGYTAIGPDGSMFGERWHENKHAFVTRPHNVKDREKKRKELRDTLKKYVDVVDFDYDFFKDKEAPKLAYNSFGKLSKNFVAITMHTRYATSGKEFANTHPFVDLKQDTSVIHNGVINNVTKDDNIRSTCDSERILNKYLEFEVNKNPNNIQKMVNSLKGYFACGVVTRDKDNARVIDMFKSRAQLHGIFIKELGMVFCTSDTDVIETANDMGLTVLYKNRFVEDRHIRIDPFTGEIKFSNKYTDTANFHTSDAHGHGRGRWQDDFMNDDDERWNRVNSKGNETNAVVHAIQKTTEIVKNAATGTRSEQSLDPHNENDAAKEGYHLDVKTGLWTKRNFKNYN